MLTLTLKLFNSNYQAPLNIGSEEQVSINQMIDMIEEIAQYKVKRKYDLTKPTGVRGRSSNNEKIKAVLEWMPKYKLYQGLEITYHWIESMLIENKNHSALYSLG